VTRPVLGLGLMLVVGVVLGACGGGLRALGPPVALTVTALDGGDLDIARYRGQVVVLHVFTTWSLAAQADTGSLDPLVDRDGVVVVGIALDAEGYLLVAPWRTASKVRYQVALASAAIRDGQSALGAIAVVPTTIVLDRAGRPIARIERQLAAGEIRDLVDRAP
jgi:hypothetical protein